MQSLFDLRDKKKLLWYWTLSKVESRTFFRCRHHNIAEMEESCLERQENELQALQAIYMDDFQDLRDKVSLYYL